jgi:hypothetical protein
VHRQLVRAGQGGERGSVAFTLAATTTSLRASALCQAAAHQVAYAVTPVAVRGRNRSLFHSIPALAAA